MTIYDVADAKSPPNMTIYDVAKYLKITDRCVRKKVATGELIAYKRWDTGCCGSVNPTSTPR